MHDDAQIHHHHTSVSNLGKLPSHPANHNYWLESPSSVMWRMVGFHDRVSNTPYTLQPTALGTPTLVFLSIWFETLNRLSLNRWGRSHLHQVDSCITEWYPRIITVISSHSDSWLVWGFAGSLRRPIIRYHMGMMPHLFLLLKIERWRIYTWTQNVSMHTTE